MPGSFEFLKGDSLVGKFLNLEGLHRACYRGVFIAACGLPECSHNAKDRMIIQCDQKIINDMTIGRYNNGLFLRDRYKKHLRCEKSCISIQQTQERVFDKTVRFLQLEKQIRFCTIFGSKKEVKCLVSFYLISYNIEALLDFSFSPKTAFHRSTCI